jgi:two-component system response regulator FixJ
MQVYIVDDESELRVSLSLVLGQAGYEVQAFATGNAFLSVAGDLAPGCVLLDLHLPDLNGLEVQRRLGECGSPHVVILLTGAGGVPEAVEAMRSGAVDFLQKPYRKHELTEALDRACGQLAEREDGRRVRDLLARLTRRETEVLIALAEGKLSKNLAFEMGLSPRTIEMYRANILKKLSVPSIGAALLLAQAGGLLAKSAG